MALPDHNTVAALFVLVFHQFASFSFSFLLFFLNCCSVSLSGRRLTSQGTRDLDRIAGQVRNDTYT